MLIPTSSLTVGPVPTTVFTPEAPWTVKTGGAIWGTPAFHDGTIYFGSDDGNLNAVDPQNGNLRWAFVTPCNVGPQNDLTLALQQEARVIFVAATKLYR